MYYSAIKYNDIANGLGVRTVLFVSGCRNRCKGCFQPETWDFCNGEVFGVKEEEEILESMKPGYVQGLTLLGGDPFEPENQEGLIAFMRRVKEQYPKRTCGRIPVICWMWIYSPVVRSMVLIQRNYFLILMCWWTVLLWRRKKV